MRVCAGIVIGACMLAASAAMPPALPQSGDLTPFDAGYLEAAAFIDDSSQAMRPDAATESDQQAPPIFGLETEPVAGKLAAKWHAVEVDIDREQQVLARCRAQEACPVVAQNLLGIVAEGAGRTGRARVAGSTGRLILPSRPAAMRRNGAWRTIGALPSRRCKPVAVIARTTRS